MTSKLASYHKLFFEVLHSHPLQVMKLRDELIVRLIQRLFVSDQPEQAESLVDELPGEVADHPFLNVVFKRVRQEIDPEIE